MLEWVDGFDHYGTSTTGAANMLLGPYAQLADGGSPMAPSTTLSRTGAGSLRIQGHNLNTRLRRAFSGDLGSVILGYAVNLDNLPKQNSFELGALGSSGATTRCSLLLTTVGSIAAYTGNWNSGTFLGESGPVITPGGWYYVEWKTIHNTTTGSIVVRVNNIEVLNLTNVNTGNSSAQWMITNAGSAVLNPAAPFYLDDLYCINPSVGAVNTDFIGDVGVYTLFPNGDSGSPDWTPSTGSDLYAMVDDTTQDGDTTYNISANIDDAYTVTYTDLPADVVNVYGVCSVFLGKKTDTGSAGITQTFDSSGTISDAPEKSITTDYIYWQDMLEQDPDVSGDWTRTSVNALKIKETQTS